MKHALPLFFRRCVRGLALVLALGSVTASGQTYSGFGFTFELRPIPASSAPGENYCEIRVTAVPGVSPADSILASIANDESELMFPLWSVGDPLNTWRVVETPVLGAPCYWMAVVYPDYLWASETVTFPENTEDEEYRLLEFSVENTTDLWRTAGIFAQEFPGVMYVNTRVAPHATQMLAIRVSSTDTTNYYAAFVDPAASAANGAFERTELDEDGNATKVTWFDVVPVSGSETPPKVASEGTPTGGGGVGGGGVIFVNPQATSPGPRTPAHTPTSGAAVAATNEHLSAVGNALGDTIAGGLSALQRTNESVGGRIQASGEIGASRIVDAIQSAFDLGPTNEKLDTIAGRLTDLDTRDTEREERENDALEAAQEAVDSSAGAGVAAGAEASGAFTSVTGAPLASKGYSISADGAPDLTVEMPAAFGGQTFDMNPFQSGRFAALCSWLRAAIAWLVIGTLGGWVWSQVAEWTRGLHTLPQARGNAAFAGTGAQATALVAAGVITVAVVTGLTALMAWSFDEINLAAFVANSTTSPFATVPAGILWMLDKVAPVATIVTAAVAKWSFNLYASTIFAAAAGAVRFVIP